MRPQSLDLIKRLVSAPSPSGYEQATAKVYREYSESFADQVTTDINGNVTSVLNPDGAMRIMLAAHTDEIGFLVHYIGDDGFLYFSAVGGHDEVVPVGQRVWVHGKERVPGVVGSSAYHLLTPDERKKRPEIKSLWIDIGATSRAEAEALVQLGDPVTYHQEFQPLLGDRASARAFDNKAGVFIIAEVLRLLREEGGLHAGVGVHAVATVQEEIGSRGARTAAFSINAQTGLAIDMDHAIDYPGISRPQNGSLEIGKGPSVSRGPNINHAVFGLVTQAAREDGIPYQVSVFPSTTPTDANAMQINQAGMATGLLGVPIRYMHTPCELLSLTDLENCVRLVAAYCRRITPETDFKPR